MSTSQDISLDDLLLDEENPRLPTTVARQQQKMIEYIARTTSISEIMEAIAENGYFPGEPLIVIPGPRSKFVAVEGNRRLTALKLLQEPTLLPKSRRIREIAESADHRPTVIPCVVFDTREEVVNYLGYRHITGVKQWEPLAKARYIAAYFDHHTAKDLPPERRYQEVARGIGSTGPYIKRQLDGMAVYSFVESKEFFHIDDLDEENISFSLVSTATGYESLLKFVARGPHPYVDRKQIINANVEFLTRWMFEKDDEGATILGDSRNIQKLAVVVSDHDALNSLKAGASLEKAYGLTKGVSEDLSSALATCETAVTRSVSMIALVEIDDSHRRQIANIHRQVKLLRSYADDN